MIFLIRTLQQTIHLYAIKKEDICAQDYRAIFHRTFYSGHFNLH